MAGTDAMKAAPKNEETKINRVTLEFRQDKDRAIISHLENQENVQAYIMKLIHEDMQRQTGPDTEKVYSIYKATEEVGAEPYIQTGCTSLDPNPELVETVESREEALRKIRNEYRSSVESFPGRSGRRIYKVTEYYAAENDALVEYSAF